MQKNNQYEKNLKVMGNYIADYSEVKKEWDKIVYSEQEIIKDKKYNRIGLVENGCEYFLVSKYPEEEVARYLQGIDLSKDQLFLIIGMAHIPLLERIVEKCSDGTRIILIEPNKYVLKYCLEHYDYSKVFAKGNIIFTSMDEIDIRIKKIIFCLEQMKWNNLIYNLQVKMLVNYTKYNKFVEEIVKIMLEQMSTSFKILGTSLEDIFMGIENDCKNLESFCRSNSIAEIYDSYKGYPGIVVSAGPSLEKNIQYLKDAQGKALIVSCDASLEACKLHGVKPDVIATIERVEATYQYYYKNKQFDDDLILVASNNIWPETLKEFLGKKILIQRIPKGPESSILQEFENVRHKDIGSSAATVAFAVAKAAGCNPIILIGQDLAFTDDKIHSNITHTRFEGENNSRTSDGSYVEDINGNMIKTNAIYNWFRNWFETATVVYEDVTVIDATEGGAKIRGTQIMTLKESIDKYCVKEKEKSLIEYLSTIEINQADELLKYKKVAENLRNDQKEIVIIKEKAKAHYQLLEEIYTDDFEEATEEQLRKAIVKMQKGNEIIQYLQEKENVYVFFQQIVKQTITHVKQISNELKVENVIENIKLQGNLMGMIMRSSEIIIEKYDEFIKNVENIIEREDGKN